MRSVNRIIKIMFLVNFDWMNSLSESLVSTAAILTTVLSVSGTCLAEFLYREKYNMWHIGRSYHSQYLYNLTGADKIELEATTTRTTGDGRDGDGDDVLSHVAENFYKFHVLGLLLLQSIYIVLQWRQNLYTTQRSLIGETGIDVK